MEGYELQAERKRDNFWKKAKRGFFCFLAGAFIVGVPLSIVIHNQRNEIEDLKTELQTLSHEKTDRNKKTDVTETVVWETLSPIGELSTYLADYGDTYSIDTTRTGIFGETVPFSQNSLNFLYHGVAKVGIDVDQIEIDVDQERQVITVSLPEPRVLDNYIMLDELHCTAKNNILNPLDVTEMPGILSACAAQGLANAENHGLNSKARTNAENVIRDLLSVFSDYRVVFK